MSSGFAPSVAATHPKGWRALLYPLGKHGSLIGLPYQGTHNLGNWQSDNAIDLGVPVGTAVVAVESGKVVKVRRHPQDGGRFAGDQVTISGPAGGFFYAHLSKTLVQPGDTIKAGQVIGASGSANGVAHLHIGAQNGDPRDLFGLRGGGGIHLPNIGKGITNVLGGAAKVGAVTALPVVGLPAGAIEAAKEVGVPGVSAAEKAVVGAITDQLGQYGARALLYTAFILGGALMVIAGIARATGLDKKAAGALKTSTKAAAAAVIK